MRKFFVLLFILTLIVSASIWPEKGTRARTMHSQTRSSPKSSSGSHSSSHSSSSSSRSSPSSTSGSTYRPQSSGTSSRTDYSTTPSGSCPDCSYDNIDEEARKEKKDFVMNKISVNSKVAFTSWDFHFSPAIQYQAAFFPTYELDLNVFGFEFSYLTTFPLQSSNLFREIPVIDQKTVSRSALLESLTLAAYPLMFLEDPLLRNLFAVEFRKTTKSTTIRAAQTLYYFPATTSPGLTEQDSDLGMIFYDQKAAGSELSYTIRERDWLFTVGFYALRAGFFDLSYSKPYQMDADIYRDDVLIDRRVYLFEGQATGQGFMISLQNLYFPNWDTSRFHFSAPDQLENGFFWGLKELGFYWGTGSIRLQNNIDLVEKYKEFYQNESGHEPTVSFLRLVFHPVIGYKINRHFKLFIEYRYANYSLSLEDNYEDASYNYFLNHAINRDTIQQFAINLTVGL
jgi:hypothetical protein